MVVQIKVAERRQPGAEEPEEPQKKKPSVTRILLPAYICVFVDFFGFGIAIPILPYFAMSLGATAFEVGVVNGIYPLAQLVGNMAFGSLSDRIGRKPVILISLVASSVSYIFAGMAKSVNVLILVRLFAGICGGTMPVAQVKRQSAVLISA
jgi:DHA1 family tetracycline resistance protein-like MFS transporter